MREVRTALQLLGGRHQRTIAAVILGLAVLAGSGPAVAGLTVWTPNQTFSSTFDARQIYRSLQVEPTMTLTGNTISVTAPFFETVSFASDRTPLSYSTNLEIYSIFNSSTPFLLSDLSFTVPDVRLVNAGPASVDEQAVVTFTVAVRDLGLSTDPSGAPVTNPTVWWGGSGGAATLNGAGYMDLGVQAVAAPAGLTYVYAPGINYALVLSVATTFTQSGAGLSVNNSTGFTLEGGYSGVHSPVTLSATLQPLPEPSGAALLLVGLAVVAARACRQRLRFRRQESHR